MINGVSQESCLGRFLCTIFRNNLLLLLKKARISLYADDSTIYLAETIRHLVYVSHLILTPKIDRQPLIDKTVSMGVDVVVRQENNDDFYNCCRRAENK